MRRIALLTLGLLAAVTTLALVLGSSAQGSSNYSFDVIFDDARGLIPGQLVDIAGAKAGSISNVTVTSKYRARIAASVSSQFRMRTNATCTIYQQGLIGENYVNCDPGSPPAPFIQASGGQPPTVPVTNTTEPVSLLDLFNIFNLPTRERFQVIIDELGIGTAGRGDDFNAVLRRANPALKLARQVIAILAHQDRQLATIIDATNTIATEGANHTAAVQNFISRAASLVSLTTNHTSSLSTAIAKLPGLLNAAQPALTQLDTVAKQGTPLLANVRTAIPYLNAVDRDIVPFANVAKPALAQVATALNTAIPAIRDATPLLKSIRAYAGRSMPSTKLFTNLAENLQRHGFFEGFFSVVYYVTAALSRYTANGHLLSILLVGPDNGQCGNYDTGAPIPACEAHFGHQPAFKPSRKAHRSARTTATTPTTTTLVPTTPLLSKPSIPSKSGGAGVPAATSQAVQQTGQALQNLVNYLLK